MTAEQVPGGWELKRSIDQLRVDQRDGFGDLKSRLDAIDDRYVTRREFEDLQDDVAGLAKKNTDDSNWRRGALLAVAVAAVGWLLTIVGLVIAVMTK